MLFNRFLLSLFILSFAWAGHAYGELSEEARRRFKKMSNESMTLMVAEEDDPLLAEPTAAAPAPAPKQPKAASAPKPAPAPEPTPVAVTKPDPKPIVAAPVAPTPVAAPAKAKSKPKTKAESAPAPKETKAKVAVAKEPAIDLIAEPTDGLAKGDVAPAKNSGSQASEAQVNALLEVLGPSKPKVKKKKRKKRIKKAKKRKRKKKRRVRSKRRSKRKGRRLASAKSYSAVSKGRSRTRVRRNRSRGIKDTFFRIGILSGLNMSESSDAASQQVRSDGGYGRNVSLGLMGDFRYKRIGLELDAYSGLAPSKSVSVLNSLTNTTETQNRSLRQSGVMANAKAQVPFRVGRFMVIPKVGAGYGIVGSTETQGTAGSEISTTSSVNGVYAMLGADVIPSKSVVMSADYAFSLIDSGSTKLSASGATSTFKANSSRFSRLRLGVYLKPFKKRRFMVGGQFHLRNLSLSNDTSSIGEEQQQWLGVLMYEF